MFRRVAAEEFSRAFQRRGSETLELTNIETARSFLRFSRAQLIGAVAVLALLWLVIVFRMLFSRA